MPGTAPTVVQIGTAELQKPAGGTSPASELSVSLPALAVAGHLLTAQIGIDKASGAFTTPAGWTPLGAAYLGVSVSQAVFYRVADGSTAERTVLLDWTNLQAANATIIEWSLNIVGAPVVTVQAVDDVAATTRALDGGAGTVDGFALAFLSVDTVYDPWAPTFDGYVVANARAGVGGGGTGPDAGGSSIAVATKALNVGTPSATTATLGVNDQPATRIARFEQAAPPPATAPAKTWAWTGALTATGFVAALKGTNLVAPRVRYSTSATMAGAVLSPVGTINAQGIARITVTGLTPGTRYYYEYEDTGTLLPGGDLTTLPTVGAPASFRFAYGSCIHQDQGDPAVLTHARAQDPRFFIVAGDFGYPDAGGAVSTIGPYRTNYDGRLTAAATAALFNHVPAVYTYDDHDGPGADNGHATSPGMVHGSAAYREAVPHPADIPATTGIYHTFVVGRVRFVVLDTRAFRSNSADADGPAKTMLGATQKAWLRNILATATERMIFVVSSVTWIGVGGGTDDHWGYYATERTELAGAITASGKRVVILAGDAHMLAHDDGTNAAAGAPVWVAGPIAHANGTIKGGPYSGGTLATSPGTRYAYVDVTDTGGAVSATWTGISSSAGAVWATTVSASKPGIALSLWDGAAEVPVLASVWDGTTQVPAVLTVT